MSNLLESSTLSGRARGNVVVLPRLGGTGRQADVGEPRRHLFALVVQRYMIEVMPQKAPGTQCSQRGHIKYWREVFGSRCIEDIRRLDIDRERERLLRKHKTTTTARRYLGTLSHVFSVAMRDWEYIDDNPVAKVRKPPNNPGRTRFLTRDEQAELIKACKAQTWNSDLYCVVLIALNSGLRLSEIQTLTWRQVDLDTRLVDLWKTKNGKPRRVPITVGTVDALREVMQERHREAAIYGRTVVADDRVFRRHFEAHFRKTVKERTSLKGVTFHTLRHTCASELVMGGKDLRTVAAILGHSSLNMVMRYAHLNTAHLSAAIDQVGDRVSV